MKKYFFVFLVFVIVFNIFIESNTKFCYADEIDFQNIINKEIEKIDLSKIESELGKNDLDFNFIDVFNSMINGTYVNNYSNIFNYIFSLFFKQIKNNITDFLIILCLIIFYSVLSITKGKLFNDEIEKIISFIIILALIIIIGKNLIQFYSKTKNTIENIANLMEIMSPIMITLLIASGGQVSSTTLSPSIIAFNGTFTFIILSIVLPLIILYVFFMIINSISIDIKFDGIANLFYSIIKWIIGLSVIVFTLFITISGIFSGSFDSLSYKITKYLLSSSIPLIGNMVSGGVDAVTFGSVIIKNSLGLSIIIYVFYLIISNVILGASISLLLKLLASVFDMFNIKQGSNLVLSFDKAVTILNVSLIGTGVCFIITILAMVLTNGSV